jgi:hypothetical protein
MKTEFRKLIARKAVHTRRQNSFKRSNRRKVRKLAQEIIDLQFEIDDDFSKEAIIARELGKTKWESFCRFGSRRNATPGLILYWIDRKAMSLDEQAMWMTEKHSREFTPDDLAEFMMNYDRGKSLYEPYQKLVELKSAFKHIAGFHFDLKFVKSHVLTIKRAREQMPF